MDLDPRRRVQAARALAVIADAVQLGLMPLFVEGGLSPVNDVLDVAVAGAMIYLVGWHWAFAPAFMAEMVPGLTLAPTWTAAILIATAGSGSPAVLPPAQPPGDPQQAIEPGPIDIGPPPPPASKP